MSDADESISIAVRGEPGRALPDFVSFSDNGDGTGELTIAPGAGDRRAYTVGVVATDQGMANPMATMPDDFDPYHLWLGIAPNEQPPNHYRLLAVEPFEDNPIRILAPMLDERGGHLATCATRVRVTSTGEPMMAPS